MKGWMKGALLSAGIFTAVSGMSQTNLSFTGQIDYNQSYGSGANDIWGYVDGTGNEYAISGIINGGVSVADVSIPSNPVEVFYAPGPASLWYDIKTYNNHAYITTEGGGGLLIIDLSPLPGNTSLPTTWFEWDQGGSFVNSAHNLYIDENGVAYICGADRGNGGVIMLDLTQNPMLPVEIGEFDDWYAHDAVARGDTLWASHISDGHFSVVDVTDPMNPVVLGTQITPVVFAHNAWFSDNNDYLFTTDEVSGAWIAAYDVTDPTDITELDRIQSNPGSGVIPHNTHFINDYLVTSYYRDGITIHDVSDPTNMIEVGNYDSSPLSGDGFDGCWGVYPWLPSGNIIASDMQAGLLVLSPTYMRGCYLEGNVTDAVTTAPLNDVSIELLSTSILGDTDISGDYSTGTVNAGSYDVAFSKPGYEPDTAFNVSLVNGQLTIVDMTLNPLIPFNLSGDVTDAVSTGGIGGAMVLVENDDYSFNFNTDGSGNITFTGVYEGTYNITVGSWGHETVCLENVVLDANNNSINIQLVPGYYDDFTFDFSWTVTGAAPKGIWERGEPNGTFFGQNPAQTDEDIQGDCFDKAFVTGNQVGGQGAGFDDVDDAATDLHSPTMDLTTYTEPYISYYRWFFNAGGQGNANDSLIVSLTDGNTTAVIDVIKGGDNAAAGGWNQVNVRVADYMAPSNNMQVIFHTADYAGGGGNLVEAAIDVFRVWEAVGVNENITSGGNLEAFPNPFSEFVNIRWNLANNTTAQLHVYDATGRLVESQTVSGQEGSQRFDVAAEAGLYIVRLVQNGETVDQVKVTKF